MVGSGEEEIFFNAEVRRGKAQRFAEGKRRGSIGRRGLLGVQGR